MSTPSEVYTFVPISKQGIIRLVALQPSQDLESPLRCSLLEAALRDLDEDIAGSYTAISYVWGDATDRNEIIVDGKMLSITTSLHTALRHIRQAHKVLHVWADGVCIDQNRWAIWTVYKRSNNGCPCVDLECY